MMSMVSSQAKIALEHALREKRRRRRRLARLPIEEKVKIVVQLQKATNDIRRASGRSARLRWRIEGLIGLGASGLDDVSEKTDEYLGKAIYQEMVRDRRILRRKMTKKS